jgi:hypothetical protein
MKPADDTTTTTSSSSRSGVDADVLLDCGET